MPVPRELSCVFGKYVMSLFLVHRAHDCNNPPMSIRLVIWTVLPGGAQQPLRPVRNDRTK